MTRGLRRFHESKQSHFITFSCHQRKAKFTHTKVYELFLQCLEEMRQNFEMCVYGYVIMPEHVHLLVDEAKVATLADAIHFLKLSFTKRLSSLTNTRPGSFWQKRYYDRNVRDEEEFAIKLRYLHLNPVKRGLVEKPEDWKWSSFRHYARREIGTVQVESEWTAADRELLATRGKFRTFLIPGYRPKNGRNPGAPSFHGFSLVARSS